MCALGRELQRHGHTVVMLGLLDIQDKIKSTGIEFHPIGHSAFPHGSLETIHQQLGQLTGLAGFNFTVKWILQELQMLFTEGIEAIREEKIDVLIVDQTTLGGSTVADYLSLPFVTVSNALLINREPGIPPFFTSWDYNTSPWAHLRNQLGNGFLYAITHAVRAQVSRQRRLWKLSPYNNDEDFFSPLLQICQLNAGFDFPRRNLVPWFHYTGPLQDPSGIEPISFPALPFPFDTLTGQPLIYASLGTLQNRKPEIFRMIAQACQGLDAQLVISLGNPNAAVEAFEILGSHIVVPYAPHQQLIQRSRMVITHAGMNTTLGALSNGVPILSLPITNEQPAIAARLVRTGAGEMLRLSDLSIEKLHATVHKVLTQDSYRLKAIQMQTEIKQSGGVRRAVTLIEQMLKTGSPVCDPKRA